MVVLGSMALDEGARAEARELLTAADFYFPAHRTIFDAFADLDADGAAVDLVLLLECLKSRGQAEAVGGGAYLAELVESTPSAANAGHYAQIVRDKAALRAIIAACTAARRDGLAGDVDAGQLAGRLQRTLYDLARRADRRPVTLAEAEQEALSHAEAVYMGDVPPGLLVGYQGIDKALGGIQPGDLVILAAGTGCGKTSLACNILEHVAAGGGSGLLVSREMGARELGKRFLQARSGVPGQRIKLAAGLRADDWTELHQARGASADYKVAVDTRSADVAGVALEARTWANHWGGPLALIVVDYLQLLTPPGDVAREHTARKVGENARRLKLLAAELGTPILLLSQLNRESARDGRPPRLHQLRESGEIEQHADAVLLLHRPETEEDGAGDTWAKVAKARDAMQTPWEGAGAIRLVWQPEITRFDG